MNFTKMQGLGNDFILVNCLSQTPGGDLSQLARRLCDRHFGIGADGLILILPSSTADIRMQIFNSDGSEPEMCGNGIRCFARHVFEKGLVPNRVIRVETLAGLIIPEIIMEGNSVKAVKVDMGEPRLERNLIPMLGPSSRVVNEPVEVLGHTHYITCVSMGNPHCVTFVPDVNDIPLSQVGPALEAHSLFPRKTNVEFIQVLNRHEVNMRVWERGAGETLACGTGACATGVASVLNGFTDRQVTVHLAGGDLVIHWAEDNHVYMTGPAENVFTGEIEVNI